MVLAAGGSCQPGAVFAQENAPLSVAPPVLLRLEEGLSEAPDPERLPQVFGVVADEEAPRVALRPDDWLPEQPRASPALVAAILPESSAVGPQRHSGLWLETALRRHSPAPATAGKELAAPPLGLLVEAGLRHGLLPRPDEVPPPVPAGWGWLAAGRREDLLVAWPAGADGEAIEPLPLWRDEAAGAGVMRGLVLRSLAPDDPEGGAAEGAAPPAPATGEGEAPAAQWGIAPFRYRWYGSLVYTYNQSFGDYVGPASTARSSQFGIEGETYIYQPWFLTVGGQASFGYGQSQTGGEAGPTNYGWGMAVNANLFGQSRFPTAGQVSYRTNVTDVNVNPRTADNLQLALRQVYRPSSGPDVYEGYWNRIIDTDTQTGRHVQDLLGGTANLVVANQPVQVRTAYSQNSSNGIAGPRLWTSSANHTYREAENWAINSDANYTQVSLKGADNQFTSSFFSVGSVMNWRAEDFEELPLSGGAAVRFVQSGVTGTSGSQSTQNLQLSGNLSYSQQLAERTDFSANVSAATSTQEGFVSQQSVAVGYRGEPAELLGFSYGWSSGASVSNSIVQTGGGGLSYSANASHSASRGLELFGGFGSVSFGQGIGFGQGGGGDPEMTLSSSGTANWSIAKGAMQGLLSVTATDNRSLIGRERWNQVGNLQLNYNWRINRISSLSANGSAAASRSESNDLSWGASGGATYAHVRVFGIPRLIFSANYRAVYEPASLTGQAKANIKQDMEASLNYRIGRTDLSGRVQYSLVDNSQQGLIYFTVARALGN